MKRVRVKRLVLTNGIGETLIGGVEYSHTLTDDNILGTIHEIGKTVWIGPNLWMLRAGVPAYRITVETFYQYQKRWYELLLDAVRRI